MIFRKHEFSDSEWQQLKPVIEIIQTSPEGESTHIWNADLVALVHELPPMCEVWDQDEEGRPICLQHSTKIAVDIVWTNDVLPEFVPHLVWPAGVGSHSLGESLDSEYMQARELHLASNNL
ncbi:hypothetical protein [Microcystis phage Mae-Yong924-2]|nr:hypothetical protein [Microcystis phage Mea-Yong924-1]QYC50735.1 hypothetical protein [Microcystis phage Mae-Yong924-2]